jgi:L-erythro-3,5-diaminohexanoate dehydrogenase
VTHSVATLGTARVITPRGVLPQAAERLDASPPCNPFEVEIAVEMLNIDAASFAQFLSAADHDPRRAEAAIIECVRARGKLVNPVTGSGGMLIGAVTAVGAAFPHPPMIGQRIASLVSLTLTPLALDAFGPVADSPRIPARGRAYLPASAAWASVPDDLPLDTTLRVLDVYGAASHVRSLAKPGDVVVILGAGNAGMLAAAAATETVGGGGRVVVVDADPARARRAVSQRVAHAWAAADVSLPLETLAAVSAVGGAAADLTVVVVSGSGCEQAAILVTAAGGVIVFFSMATSFAAAALAAEGVASTARLLIGSGYAADLGSYALGLVRRYPSLLDEQPRTRTGR